MKNIDDFKVVFETERIYFVKVSEKLIEDYLNMVNDIEVQKYISHNRKKYSLEDELEWIENKLKENAVIFSMIEKGTNEFIGNIEIMDIEDKKGELGIAITSLKQNKRFGQEAIKKIIDYAFNTLNLDSLDLNVYDFNPRAIHCYEKVGFKRVGQGKAKEDIHMIVTK